MQTLKNLVQIAHFFQFSKLTANNIKYITIPAGIDNDGNLYYDDGKWG